MTDDQSGQVKVPIPSHQEWLKLAPQARAHFAVEIETLLAAVPQTLWDDSNICGINYDFLPWHQLSVLSFQSRGEDPNDIGGWEHYECVNPDGRALGEEFELYERSADGGLVYHRLLIEAAEALLSVDLERYGHDDTIEDGYLNKCFQLQVYHGDARFGFNYCEYVLARRFER